MGIYEDRPTPTPPLQKAEGSSKEEYSEIIYQFDPIDSIIYLVGEIDQYTLTDIMTRVRTILRFRQEDDNSPINLIINSEGGCLYEMLGIIDYMNSLQAPINTICRGKAFSAAAVILTCGTGIRYASKHASIMFHQSSSWLQGKQSDVKANIHHISYLDTMTNQLLEQKTNISAAQWEQNQRTDFWLSTDKALELKIIDEII